MTDQLKPYAWSVCQIGCRAPDDCEEYEEILSDDDFNAMPNKGKYIKHGMCMPLYEIPEGYQLVPIEPSIDLLRGAQDQFCKFYGWGQAELRNAYKAMLKDAGDKND